MVLVYIQARNPKLAWTALAPFICAVLTTVISTGTDGTEINYNYDDTEFIQTVGENKINTFLHYYTHTYMQMFYTNHLTQSV